MVQEENEYISNHDRYYTSSNMLSVPSLRKLCDVVFIVDDERFPAHRIIVAAASPVLEAMLTNGMGETYSTEIPIPVTDKVTWALALRFMYTGCVKIENTTIAKKLVRLAHNFQLLPLMNTVECYLCKHVEKDSFILIYHFADKYDLMKLKSYYEKKMEKTITTVKKESGFKGIPLEVIDSIIRKDSVQVVCELDIFLAICSWANIPEPENDGTSIMTSESKIEEATKLLRNLRVEKMQA